MPYERDPRPFGQLPPRRLEVTRGRRMPVLGVPLLAAGIGIVVAALFGSFATGHGWGAPFVPLGATLAAAGAGMSFVRWGWVVDGRDRTITRWWGVPFPIAGRPVSLEGVTHVAVSEDLRLSDASRYRHLNVLFPVRLVRPEGAVEVEAPRDRERALRLAERLAKVLDVGMEDSSSGEVVARSAEDLDESLRGRARRTGERPPQPAPLAVTRLRVSLGDYDKIFEIPAPGIRGRHLAIVGMRLLIAVPALLVGGVLAAAVLGDEVRPSRRRYVGVVAAATLGAGVIALASSVSAAGSALCARRLRVTPDGMRLEVAGPLRTQVTELAAEEIEEVEAVEGLEDCGPLHGAVRAPARLIVRADFAEIEFGRGLSREELEWLRDTVRFVLTS